MGNVSSFFTQRKTIKDDIQRLVDINIEFLNSLEDSETVMDAVNDTTEGE